MYLNKATIIGNLTSDPELKALPSGQKVATFSIATNRYWKDASSGERKEAVDYHNIVVYANHLLRSAYPSMMSSAQSILRHNRSKEAEQQLITVKDLFNLIPANYDRS